jgi:tetratricopeptide (TPR) repeat protein
MTWSYHHRAKPGPLRPALSRAAAGIPAGMKGFRLGRSAYGRRYPSLGVPIHYRRYSHTSPSITRRAAAASWQGGPAPVTSHQARYIGLGAFAALAGFTVAFFALNAGLVIMATGCAIIALALATRRSRLERALRQGAALLGAGKPREALDRLLPFARYYPKDQALLRWLGLASSRAGQPELAERTLREMHERTNTSISAQLYADQLRLNGKIREAIEVLEKVTPEADRAAAHYTLLGNCFLELGEVETAIDTFKRGPILKRKLDWDLMALHLALGSAYEELDNREAALRHYERVGFVNMKFEDVEARIRRLLATDEVSHSGELDAGGPR